LTRSDFVAFGENVQDLPEATAVARACDVMLIIGTSGVVYPAAALPEVAKSNGARMIEINARESELTAACDLFIRAPAGEALPEIVRRVEGLHASAD
jgi:NAD-dependent deacetylase